MSGLTFTEDAARQLEKVYLTTDVVAQRAETLKLLALSGGERVLDIGCGPGAFCAKAWPPPSAPTAASPASIFRAT